MLLTLPLHDNNTKCGLHKGQAECFEKRYKMKGTGCPFHHQLNETKFPVQTGGGYGPLLNHKQVHVLGQLSQSASHHIAIIITNILKSISSQLLRALHTVPQKHTSQLSIPFGAAQYL